MHSEEFAELQKSISELKQTVAELQTAIEQLTEPVYYEVQQELMHIAEASVPQNGKGMKITSPMDAYTLLKHTAKLEQEELRVILLNRKHMVIDVAMVFKGTIDSSIVDPRDIFRIALRKCAVAVILSHNHPSGDASLSQEDIRATQSIVEAGKILNTKVLDHIVIGKAGFLSMKEQGVL